MTEIFFPGSSYREQGLRAGGGNDTPSCLRYIAELRTHDIRCELDPNGVN